MSIGFSFAKASSASRGKKLRPGTYKSEVVSLGFSEEHVKESTYEIHYKVVTDSGEEHDFREFIYNDPYNKRTKKFFKYLEKIGVPLDDLEKFIGTKEILVLKKSTRGPFLTIESREEDI